MKNIYQILTIYFLVITSFTACSTAKVRILPGEDGINRVSSKDREKDGAEEAALDKANSYCENQKKQMLVVREDKTSYEGSMNEETRNAIRKASKLAMLGAWPVGIFSKSTALGSAVGGAGLVGHTMTNDRDYEAKFSFRCK